MQNAASHFQGLKFIPVRGRKHRRGFDVRNHPLVEIYPREGTETPKRQIMLVRLSLKFNPVRGRKRFKLLDVGERVVEIYPREGTETWR